jgi:hypothetical protein
MRLTVSNIDGPNIIVQPWEGAGFISVPCGRTVQIGDAASPRGPWDVRVTDRATDEVLFEKTLDGPDIYLRVAPGGVVAGDSPLSGPGPPEGACSSPQL